MGFTLVELLVVLTLLAIVMSVAVPSLAGFFRGRSLDSEARRLLALTRLAQSRAVTEGVPMHLWVDEEKRAYGVREEAGWGEERAASQEFELSPDLEVELVRTNVVLRTTASLRVEASQGVSTRERNLPGIHFLPDGSIGELSPPAIILTDRDGASVELALSSHRLKYEIRRNHENR